VWVSNDGCLASSDAYHYEAPTNTTSINNYNNISQIKILPNPVREELLLQLSTQLISDINLEVTDGLGRIVLKSKISVNDKQVNHKIDVKTLSSGIYYVHLKNENGVTITKFIKQE
jgi:Secretion system C-terminal sorting domain